MISTIFINMPVSDLAKSKDFFTSLGFTFNPQFTNEESGCLIIAPDKFAMLNVKSKFQGFIDKPIADKSTSEVVISLGCDSKEIVKQIAEAAFAKGARKINEPEDIGFMFSWSFEDLDGHLWDLFWMDPAHVQ